MYAIDLNDLAARESEQVEWKENVASIESVVETIVAFANDYSNLGGGYIVCGAEETKDEAGFQKVNYLGLNASRLKEIEGIILTHCRERIDPPIVPIIEEISIPDSDKRILVFIVPATGTPHSYRSSGKNASTFYIRIGRETREALNSLLRELLVKKKALEPWDKRKNSESELKDIDPIILRDSLQSMGLWDSRKSLEDYASPDCSISTFVPSFAVREPLTNHIHARNYALLMFNRNPERFFPGAFSVLSFYHGIDRSESTAERLDITGPIVEQARRLIERLNLESSIAFDKTDDKPNAVKYPQRAIQEAIINALVHRDYEIDQPVRITVFSDRIEIYSPGSLHRAIDKEKFIQGKATPFWRNQSLAYFFNKLQLAQAEGQGIPTILRLMQDAGCPDPVFEIHDEYVTCILPAHPRHIRMRLLSDIESKLMAGNAKEAAAQLEKLLGNDPSNPRMIRLFCEACNQAGAPHRVLEFITTHSMECDRMNPSTLISISESLSLIPKNERARRLSEQLLHRASQTLQKNLER